MALSTNTPIKEVLGDFADLPLYQAIKAYEGAMLFLRADGYVTNLAGGLPFLGHADALADNTNGASGALNVRIRRGSYRAQVTISGVALANVGDPVYASDDGTLALVNTSDSLVGRVVRYVTTDTCIVEFTPIGSTVITVAEQAHIADAKVDYTTGDLDLEAEIIAAFNTTNGKINALLAALESAGVLASS
jgi:hypothetical protein